MMPELLGSINGGSRERTRASLLMAGQNKTANPIFAAEEHNQQKIENSQF
jgi:hypothetical protein